jgi:hypothetical protein
MANASRILLLSDAHIPALGARSPVGAESKM